jgi:hypothetical protein
MYEPLNPSHLAAAETCILTTLRHVRLLCHLRVDVAAGETRWHLLAGTGW